MWRYHVSVAKLRDAKRQEEEMIEREIEARYGPLNEQELITTKRGILVLSAHRHILSECGFTLPEDGKSASISQDAAYVELAFEHPSSVSRFLLCFSFHAGRSELCDGGLYYCCLVG